MTELNDNEPFGDERKESLSNDEMDYYEDESYTE